jgi:hypothetical protein
MQKLQNRTDKNLLYEMLLLLLHAVAGILPKIGSRLYALQILHHQGVIRKQDSEILLDRLLVIDGQQSEGAIQ